MPAKVEGQALYIRLSDLGGASSLYRLAEQYGEYRPRYGEQGVENDPSYQQLIMYAYVVKGERVLVYQRDTTGQYSDNRLSGKISVGIGGHMDPTDESLEYSLWREVEEEADILADGKPTCFRDNDGRLDVEAMRRALDIEPVGLLKDGRDSVGMVHLGLICRITAKDKVDVRLKAGDKEEAASFTYLTSGEYEAMAAKGEVSPEGWTEIVMQNEVMPLIRQP